MYKRILLPLDGSSLAEQALSHAVAQAERFQAELILMRVFEVLAEPPGVWSPAVRQAEKSVKALAVRYLERVAAEVRERGILAQVHTVEGRPHVEIVEYAGAHEVDLIVMCTRGQS